MLNFLELALNNNYIYIGIIAILVIIIIITIISIKKDKENEEVEEVKNETLDVVSEEPKKSDSLIELEKVVGEMQKKIDETAKEKNDIDTYEREQEETAIISYQELIKAVKSKENESTAHNEVGMELADTNVVENEEVKNDIKEPDIEIKRDTLDSVENTKNENEVFDRHFKTTEFISPIYGKEPQSDIKNLEKNDPNKEVTMDDIIDEDFEEEDEFLDSLKNFRKNL